MEKVEGVQTWTFNDMGRKFFVMKKKNLYKIKIQNIFSQEWHESQDVQFKRINQQTIKAAFDPKIQAVSYDLLQNSLDQIILIFKVKIEYLATEFSQEIILKKILVSKDQTISLELNELMTQIKIIQKMVDQQSNRVNKNLIKQTINFNSKKVKLWQFQLGKGKYIFQLNGYFVLQKIYNGQYYEENDMFYDSNGNYQANLANLSRIPLKLKIKSGKQIKRQLMTPVPNFRDAYQFPYYFTFILEIAKDSQIQIQVDQDPNNAFMMNNNLIVVSPVITYQ